MSAFVTFNPLIPVLICSMSGLAYCSNQKRQRMCKPRSCRLVVLVLHGWPAVFTVSAGSTGSRGMLDTFSLVTLESLKQDYRALPGA